MGSTRRNFLKNISILGTFPFVDIDTLRTIREQPPAPSPVAESYGNVIEAPEDTAKWQEFRKELHVWRESKRKELNYTGASYKDPSFHWASLRVQRFQVAAHQNHWCYQVRA